MIHKNLQMWHFRVLLMTAATAVLAGGRVDADWPTYRGDIARRGVTGDRVDPNLHLQWRFSPLAAPRPAWPAPAEELPRMHNDNAFHAVVADGVVYFGSSVTNRVLAITAATGDVRWTFFADGPVRFAPTVADGRVYFGADDGHVYCLRAGDGQQIWKYRAGPSDEHVIGNGRMISLWPVRTNVLVDGGTAYFAAGVFPYDGIFICALDAATGSVVWRNDTIGDRAYAIEFGGISPHGYLVASPQTLFVPSGRAMPAAFDRATGKFKYTAPPGGKRGGTWTLLDQDRLIAGTDNSGVPAKMSYDAQTGRLQGDAFAWFNGTDMVLTDDVVYLITDRGVDAVNRKVYAAAMRESNQLTAHIAKLGQAVAKLKKQRAEGDPKNKSLAPQLKTAQGELATAQSRQRELRNSIYSWRVAASNLTAVIRSGNLVVAGGEGTVIGLDASTGKQVWAEKVTGRAVGLAAGGGNVVVSTDSGHVYCFGSHPAPAMVNITTAPAPRQVYASSPDAEMYRRAAEQILKRAGVAKGYCLVLDCGDGNLAYELAQRTELNIIGLESDPDRCAVARRRLLQAGVLGRRVTVATWDIASLPDYFANLVVSDRALKTGKTAISAPERFRVLRPWGGVELLGKFARNAAALQQRVRGPLEGAGSWTQQYADAGNTACSDDELVGGPLGIAWYGEPGPQGMVERHAEAEAPLALDGRLFIQGEERVQAVDAFNGTMLWQREIPGAVRVKVKRDSGNIVVTPAGLFIAARDKCIRISPETGATIRVYDLPTAGLDGPRRWGYITVVNGVLYGSAATAMSQPYAELLKVCLDENGWKKPDEIPAAYRTDYERYKRTYPDPAGLRMVAERSGLLYRNMTRFAYGGEFTQKGAVTPRLMTGDRLFAIDVESGKALWQYDGKRIANIAITVGGGRVYLTDAAVSDAEKKAALVQRERLVMDGVYHLRDAARSELQQHTQQLAKYEEQRRQLVKEHKDVRSLDRRLDQIRYVVSALQAEFFTSDLRQGTLSLADADVRRVVALDAQTGNVQWQKVVDLTGCCGDSMGAAFHDGVLLFFGNFGNHDAWRFSAGGLKWRRITVLDAADGDMVWSRALNYRTRPVIVGDRIIIEPRACDLKTGQIVKRRHPITGAQVEWEFLRPGHTCGITAASADGLFYRSACAAFYDLKADRGVALFGAYRPGCAISVVPACGMLLSAEAAAGCTCSYPIRCTVALRHKPARPQPWTVYVTPGELKPVQHLALNLGAVGDMKDADGTVWFAYPNPNTSRYNHFPNYGVKLNLGETVAPQGAYFAQDFKGVTMPGTERPWLFTSGCRGLTRCELPLVDPAKDGGPRTYTVRLGLRTPELGGPAPGPVDVKLQGRVVARGFNIAPLTLPTPRPVVLEYDDITVKDVLTVELTPRAGGLTPTVCFIEVVGAATAE